MHRSGTSMLAGSLQEAGLVLGDVVTHAPHNRKGNRENRAIMFMQEDLLMCNGGTWDDPPETIQWGALHTAVRDLFVAGFQDEQIWGFKDPRTLITLDGWLDVLPDAEFVGIFRHPARVAFSLERRDHFSLEKSFRLWQVYNQRLLHLHQVHSFPLIEFHKDVDVLQGKLHHLIGLLKLPYRPRLLTFFEDVLRQKELMQQPLPADVQHMYQELRERAI
jgi:hypothetical protein